MTDHAVSPTNSTVDTSRLGQTLLVVESALPGDDAERDVRAAEATRIVRESLAFVTGRFGEGELAGDDQLLGIARANGLDSVLIVRIEDYARHGNLYVALAVPPVSWDADTTVSLRVRALDAKTGAVFADLRRDRVRGGLFVNRTTGDLPEEIRAAIQSLVVKG
ncbi:MAG TPA: hypothetical protein VN809_14680 [Telmatospirillum sp.]|nr:hypothetical protein [Telmatospirillum sp.]